MKKKPAFRSAFFNPLVLISFAFCAILLALVAFALYPGATARAQGPEQNQSSAQDFAQENIMEPEGTCSLAWSASTVYPIVIADAAAVTIGSNIYVFGGVSNSVASTAANKFDGTTWTAIAPFTYDSAGSGSGHRWHFRLHY